MPSKLELARPYVGLKELYSVFRSLLKTEVSARTQIMDQVETEISLHLGHSQTILTSNGTVALIAVLEALKGILKRDTLVVGVPNITFAATVNAVALSGCTPILMAVDRQTGLVSYDQEISKVIDVVIIVQLNGRLVDQECVEKFASDSVYVIEDCAEGYLSHYSTPKARRDFVLATTTSFYGNKFVTSGEGGSISYSDHAFGRYLSQVINHGMCRPGSYRHDVLGGNYRMSALSAALLNAQWSRIQEITADRLEFHQQIQTAVEKNSLITMPPLQPLEVPWLIEVAVNEKTPGRFITFLEERDIACRYFFEPMHTQPAFGGFNCHGPVDGDKDFSRGRYFLPTHFRMSNKNRSRLSAALLEYDHES